MLWEYSYHCPCCDHHLSNDQQIHFLIKTEDNEKANLCLNARPAVYGYESDTDLNLETGDKLQFFCSKCNANLQSKSHPDMVQILLKVTDDIVFDILFSPVFGKKVTYVVMDDELVKYRDNFFAHHLGKKAG